MATPDRSRPTPDPDDFDRYLPPAAPSAYRVGVPPSLPQELPTLPNTVDPMGRIYAEGLIYRRLKDRHTPWWVTITGCLWLGLPGLFVIGFALAQVLELAQEWEAVATGRDALNLGVLFLLLVLMAGLGGTTVAIALRTLAARRPR